MSRKRYWIEAMGSRQIHYDLCVFAKMNWAVMVQNRGIGTMQNLKRLNASEIVVDPKIL